MLKLLPGLQNNPESESMTLEESSDLVERSP